MEVMVMNGLTAKNLATMLVDECNKLYAEKPGDDTTACVVKVRRREPMNILFGPPANPNDADKMMSLFFAKSGKHIVCGGTTSRIASEYLGKPLVTSTEFSDDDIPPAGSIEGVDLVTEGILTINRVLDYARDYLEDNETYSRWCYKRDGASLLARMLFEEATDINFFVGRAVNPAHQDPEMAISFDIKMRLLRDLADCLKQMGKTIRVNYF